MRIPHVCSIMDSLSLCEKLQYGRQLAKRVFKNSSGDYVVQVPFQHASPTYYARHMSKAACLSRHSTAPARWFSFRAARISQPHLAPGTRYENQVPSALTRELEFSMKKKQECALKIYAASIKFLGCFLTTQTCSNTWSFKAGARVQFKRSFGKDGIAPR
jgi:hypothetical protein